MLRFKVIVLTHLFLVCVIKQRLSKDTYIFASEGDELKLRFACDLYMMVSGRV
jgi:hypothetical protein